MGSGAEPPTSQWGMAGRNSPESTSRKILIIEDNANFARLLGLYLRSFGHEVEIVAEGTTGLEKVREIAPDVVICDMRLPDLDGWSIARELDESSTYQRPALLIALTGFSGNRERAQSRSTCFDLHITKPPDFEKLEQVVSGLSIQAYI
jgi:CheY-like chemotaxis protein